MLLHLIELVWTGIDFINEQVTRHFLNENFLMRKINKKNQKVQIRMKKISFYEIIAQR